jgi:hypothetical protein
LEREIIVAQMLKKGMGGKPFQHSVEALAMLPSARGRKNPYLVNNIE